MPVSEQVWASSEIKFPTADSKIWFDAMVSKDGVHQNGLLNMEAEAYLLRKQRFYEVA